MDLATMRTRTRTDLKDTDENSYRWSDTVLDRHIDHAVREYSRVSPREMKAVLATVADSRELDISSLTDRVSVYAAEYPAGEFPQRYSRFSIYQDTLTLLGDDVPDGSNAYIYYGKLHTLDGSSSTIPSQHEDLIAAGAEAFALTEYAAYAIDRLSTGGEQVAQRFRIRGEELYRHFKKELKRIKSRLRSKSLYSPAAASVSKSTDWGPQ